MIYRFIAFFIIGICIALFVNTLPQKNTSTKPAINPMKFFDEIALQEGLSYTKSNPIEKKNTIRAGIVPHHLLVGFIVADFFNNLSYSNPTTIIILGPNHYEKGESDIVSGVNSWQTHAGIVEADTAVVASLHANRIAKIDEDIISNDHSTAALMPFIKEYIPGARVVSILLKKNTSQSEIDRLVKTLSPFLNSKTVVIASVDFSHYLSSNEAIEKDEISLAAINGYDYKRILTFNSDYMDSPAAIVAMLGIVRHQNTATQKILHHTNSGILYNKKNEPVTSYFSIVYY